MQSAARHGGLGHSSSHWHPTLILQAGAPGGQHGDACAPQVTGANPGGCGQSERRAGSQRSLAAASSPGLEVTSSCRPARSPESFQCSFTVVAESLPAPTRRMCSGVDLGVMPASSPITSILGLRYLLGERHACLCRRGLLPMSPEISDQLWAELTRPRRTYPCAMPFLETPVCISCMFTFPLFPPHQTHSSQLFPPDLFREDSSAKPRKSLPYKVSPIIRFLSLEWCVCVDTHTQGERERK